jgi:hypothetical protein
LFCFRGANIGQKNDSANFSSKKMQKNDNFFGFAPFLGILRGYLE